MADIDFGSNKYTPDNEYPTNLKDQLSEQRKRMKSALNKKNLYIAEEIALHLLNTRNKTWNAKAKELALTIPGATNIPDTAEATILDLFGRQLDVTKALKEKIFGRKPTKTIQDRLEDFGLVVGYNKPDSKEEHKVTQIFDENSQAKDSFYKSWPMKNGNELYMLKLESLFTEPENLDKEIYLWCGVEEEVTENFSVDWNMERFLGGTQSIPTWAGNDRTFDLNLSLFATHIGNDIPGYNDKYLNPDYMDGLNIEREKQNKEFIAKPDTVFFSEYKKKIEWIVNHTYPTFNKDSTMREAPVLRLTFGNLFNDLPVVITGLNITWKTPWVMLPNYVFPMYADINLSFHVIEESMPSADSGQYFYKLG